MCPVQQTRVTFRSPTGCDPRQTPLSSRALSSKPTSVLFKGKEVRIRFPGDLCSFLFFTPLSCLHKAMCRTIPENL